MLAETDLVTGPVAGPRSWRLDAALVIALCLSAATFGTLRVRISMAHGHMPQFYQNEFAPAVMAACGRGYVAPVVRTIPSLQSFLSLETGSFECADLPAKVDV